MVSARLDLVAPIERQTTTNPLRAPCLCRKRPLALSHHQCVRVVLSQNSSSCSMTLTTPPSWSWRAICSTPTRPPTSRNSSRQLSSRLPRFLARCDSFARPSNHRLIVLPGEGRLRASRSRTRTAEPRSSSACQLPKTSCSRSRVPHGVRDVFVCAGNSDVDLELADASERSDADRLEDPSAFTRFVTSRVLYRRLGPWVWLPVLALVGFDLFNTITKIVESLHAPSLQGARTPHAHVLGQSRREHDRHRRCSKPLVAGLAGLIVRRRFDRDSRSERTASLSEPLAITYAYDVDALEIARRVVERGGAGAVVGGAPRVPPSHSLTTVSVRRRDLLAR